MKSLRAFHVCGQLAMFQTSDFENFMDKGCDSDWIAARSKGHNIENTREETKVCSHICLNG